jgi:hypothetical protein
VSDPRWIRQALTEPLVLAGQVIVLTIAKDDPPPEVTKLFLRNLVKQARVLGKEYDIEDPEKRLRTVADTCIRNLKKDKEIAPDQVERVRKYFPRGWYEQYLPQL